jgi:hypothetical protein
MSDLKLIGANRQLPMTCNPAEAVRPDVIP